MTAVAPYVSQLRAKNLAVLHSIRPAVLQPGARRDLSAFVDDPLVHRHFATIRDPTRPLRTLHRAYLAGGDDLRKLSLPLVAEDELQCRFDRMTFVVATRKPAALVKVSDVFKTDKDALLLERLGVERVSNPSTAASSDRPIGHHGGLSRSRAYVTSVYFGELPGHSQFHSLWRLVARSALKSAVDCPSTNPGA